MLKAFFSPGTRTAASLATASLLLAGIASGYYHNLYFNTRIGPFSPIPVRFDLGSIPGKTVYYFVSDQGPTKYAPGDSFESVVSQVRAAAEIWNGVSTSDLRIQFGGITAAGTPQAGPGIDVTFDDDLDPTILARGGVVTKADINTYQSGGFIPILRSKVRLRRDLSADLSKYPSYTDAFFLTVVHELGHTLGLQHTLTSSVMSTFVTRSTTKAKPLGADDIAGISLLYPSSRFGITTGSISGRVTYSNNGQGISLASIVAISPTGQGVSAFSNPDGTYRIDGLLPGQYVLYVHPLPPPLASQTNPADIILPLDTTGNPFQVSPAFDTVFFQGSQGTRDPSQAWQLSVFVGATTDNVNFSVAQRSAAATASVEIYGFFGQVPVKSPPMLPNVQKTMVFTGPGLIVRGQPAPGLSAALLGENGVVPGSLKIYQYSSDYLQVDINHTFDLGPRHLVLSLNNDLYVLPSAMTVVQNSPPSVTSVTPGFDETGNRTAIISGSNLTAASHIWFDGAPAKFQKVNSDGSLTVTPPPAAGSFSAHVVALNSDGQTSAFALGAVPPPLYGYDSSATPEIRVSPGSLQAGTDAMIQVSGSNFADGQTMVGFGSSDVTVKRQWVVNPTRLVLNVSVNPNAPPTSTTLTVASGLLLVSQPYSFQILSTSWNQISLRAPVLNQATGLAGTPAGGIAVVQVSNLPSGSSGLLLSVAGQQATILANNGGQLVFQVPAGLSTGPAELRLTASSGDPIQPIAMQIDAPAPQITGVAGSGGFAISSDFNPSAKPGDTVTLLVNGLYDGVALTNPAVRVAVGGIDQGAVSVSAPSQTGTYQVAFTLSPGLGTGSQPVTLTVDTRMSAPFTLTVR